ncbi:MAG: hypothetical protein HXX20_02955 [Chloroflexi bacterium]|nr:hypothetical protein [Chloroflexota bacterium]
MTTDTVPPTEETKELQIPNDVYVGLNVVRKHVTEFFYRASTQGLLSTGESVLAIFDCILLKPDGRRLGSLTLHDYAILTDQHLIIWGRGLNNDIIEKLEWSSIGLEKFGRRTPLEGVLKVAYNLKSNSNKRRISFKGDVTSDSAEAIVPEHPATSLTYLDLMPVEDVRVCASMIRFLIKGTNDGTGSGIFKEHFRPDITRSQKRLSQVNSLLQLFYVDLGNGVLVEADTAKDLQNVQSSPYRGPASPYRGVNSPYIHHTSRGQSSAGEVPREKKPAIQNKKPVVSSPDKKPVVSSPDKKPVVSSPDKKPVASSPDKKPVASSPDKKSAGGTTAPKPASKLDTIQFGPKLGSGSVSSKVAPKLESKPKAATTPPKSSATAPKAAPKPQASKPAPKADTGDRSSKPAAPKAPAPSSSGAGGLTSKLDAYENRVAGRTGSIPSNTTTQESVPSASSSKVREPLKPSNRVAAPVERVATRPTAVRAERLPRTNAPKTRRALARRSTSSEGEVVPATPPTFTVRPLTIPLPLTLGREILNPYSLSRLVRGLWFDPISVIRSADNLTRTAGAIVDIADVVVTDEEARTVAVTKVRSTAYSIFRDNPVLRYTVWPFVKPVLDLVLLPEEVEMQRTRLHVRTVEQKTTKDEVKLTHLGAMTGEDVLTRKLPANVPVASAKAPTPAAPKPAPAPTANVAPALNPAVPKPAPAPAPAVSITKPAPTPSAAPVSPVTKPAPAPTPSVTSAPSVSKSVPTSDVDTTAVSVKKPTPAPSAESTISLPKSTPAPTPSATPAPSVSKSVPTSDVDTTTVSVAKPNPVSAPSAEPTISLPKSAPVPSTTKPSTPSATPVPSVTKPVSTSDATTTVSVTKPNPVSAPSAEPTISLPKPNPAPSASKPNPAPSAPKPNPAPSGNVPPKSGQTPPTAPKPQPSSNPSGKPGGSSGSGTPPPSGNVPPKSGQTQPNAPKSQPSSNPSGKPGGSSGSGTPPPSGKPNGGAGKDKRERDKDDGSKKGESNKK